MADKVVGVVLRAKVEGFVAGMHKAKASVDDLTKAATPKKADAFKAMADKAAIAGVAVAAGIGVAVKRFADFDKAMSAVQANSGATGAELESLRQAAIKLGADSQFSATEAAEGINEMAKAGVAAKDVLGGGLKGALDLAAAGQIGVAEAAETAATAMTQFRLDGSKVPHIADLLTNAANKAQGGVGDMGMALKQAGLVASQMGLSIEETTAGLTAFASAGLIGSDAGTSFKSMLQRLTPQSDAAAEAMAQVGLDAYDAQGNFIGLEAVAGQLKTGMANLSEEQRNAALTTIFGSDAVRAAAVLYNEGAEGIQKWTKEVSEQGAAAKQAATLTDNLMGDIERLGGAFDSVLIQGGSSANSGLRILVQGLTGVVDIVGKIPGPALMATTAMAAFALLAPKGVLMWRNYTAQLDTLGLSLDKITAKAPRAGAALSFIGKATTVTAVASIAVGIKEWAAAAGVADPATERLAKGLQALADGAKESMDFGTIFARGMGPFRNNVEDTDKALEQFGANARAALDPAWYETALGTGGQALAVFEERAKQLDAAFTQMVAGGNIDGAKAAFDRLAEAAAAQGIPVEKLKEWFPQYAGAIDQAAAAATNATDPTAEMATETDKLEKAAKDAKEALDALQEAILGLGSPVSRQRAATNDYEEAIDNAAQALKDYKQELIDGRLEALGITDATDAQRKAAEKWATQQMKNTDLLDEGTDAGRTNRANLDTLKASTLEKVAADFALTESTQGVDAATKVATETMKKGREAFVRAATAAGMTKDEANELADQLGLIPDNVKILVSQSGAKAAGDAIDYAARNRTATITVNTKQVRVSGVDSKAVWGRGFLEGNMATGGPVHGPGTGTSDTAGVFALSNGEHVLTAAEVAAAGGHAAIFALRKAILTGGIQFRATGGPTTTPQFRYITPPPAPMASSAGFSEEALARAVARHMPRALSVYSGDDARAAARDAIRTDHWKARNGG